MGSIRSRNQNFQSNTEIINNQILEYFNSHSTQSYENSDRSEIHDQRNYTFSRPSNSLSLQNSSYSFWSEIKTNTYII